VLSHHAAGGYGLRFSKGLCTGNDFVLFADPDGRIDFDEAMARQLTDRRQGIGADGAIRAVQSAALPEGQALLAEEPNAQWFMDYRNPDGSLAKMGGNGARVYAAYLADQGLAELPDGGSITIGTRSGAVLVHREGHEYSIDMGKWSFPGGQAAVRGGRDTQVSVRGLARELAGLSVVVGNSHVVSRVSAAELAALDLSVAPVLTPAPADGANVEFAVVAPAGPCDATGQIEMRVYGRGLGESKSCGTGACAAALAAWAWTGPTGPTCWTVQTPGGDLSVRLLGDQIELSGPVTLIAEDSPAE